MELVTRQTNDDVNFRDLNKNGRLDPYEDPRRPIAERVEDLLAQMTLEEKVSLLAGSSMWYTMPVERLGIPAIGADLATP